jgi:beta-glucanase (GH16 family)
MRGLKVAFGLLIVAALVIWDTGLHGHHTSTSGTAAPASTTGTAAPASRSSSPTPNPIASPAISGVIQPEGKPEFAASFTGSKLDTSVWDTCYPWLSQSGCKNFGNFEESEWYLPSQVYVSDGLLHLRAQRKVTEGTVTAGGAPKQYDCRSGMVTSYPGFTFKYGYVQIVAWIPSSPGLWPALWLDPANFSWPPEMDIVESWGHGAYAGSFFHFGRHGRGRNREVYSPPSRVAGWHIFALSWTKTQMTWLVDGKVTMTVRKNVPDQKMMIIADLASYKPIGGANQCNGLLLIRSVDVWKA